VEKIVNSWLTTGSRQHRVDAMNPGPSLPELIATIRTDAGSADPLDELVTAVHTVAELEEVADAALAHFVDQCRGSGRSWSEISRALGVSKQAAHKRFSFAAPSLERFTPRARAALRAAVDAARSLGHVDVGTEHILLGLFEPSGGIAARIFAETGITRAAIEGRILAVRPRGSALAAEDSDPPFSPPAAECLARAVTEALALRHNYIGTEHLLLAVFADPESLAATILTESGVTRDDYRRRVEEKLLAVISAKTT
jgi:hypothetical protein